MKILGIGLLVMTLLLAGLKFGEVSVWSLGLGVALSAGLFLSIVKPEKPQAPVENPWEGRFHELETHSSQTIDGLNREVQKLQQKLLRTEERCLSYQKLVDVHQGEIDTLKTDKDHLQEQLVQKERKLAEHQLARLEPDLFDV